MPIHLQQGNLIECHLPTNKWRMHHSVVKNKNYHHVPLSAFFAAVTKVAPQFRICVRHIIHFFSRLMTEKKIGSAIYAHPARHQAQHSAPQLPAQQKKHATLSHTSMLDTIKIYSHSSINISMEWHISRNKTHSTKPTNVTQLQW